MSQSKKIQNNQLRKMRVRSKVYGTAERPRMSVTISNKHVSVQIINDESARTLVSATSVGQKQVKSIAENAVIVGTQIAKNAKKANITKVVLDRNGRLYAKRLNMLADAARKEGLEL